jgi:hypothetical protein
MTLGAYTLFTSVSPLGKKFTLVDGELTKQAMANMYAGSYDVKSYTSAEDLITQMQEVSTMQAISASLPVDGTLTGGITTTLKPKAGCLSRITENFAFAKAGGGILTLDYDPRGTTLTREELVQTIRDIGVIPPETALIWWCSGSSYIFNKNEEIQSLKGQRLYFLVEHAADIPRAGKAIADRCWLADLGFILIGDDGKRHYRGLFDNAMFEPARLDFAGGAICEAPLRQDRGAPVNFGGEGLLDTYTAFPELSEAEKILVATKKKQEYDKAEPEAAAQHERYLSREGQKMAARLISEGASPREANERARAILKSATEGQGLTSSFKITIEGGKSLTVKELLDNRLQYHGVQTLDPIEPDHRGGEYCGILFLKQNNPTLYSFAHGGTTYNLIRQVVDIEVIRNNIAITGGAIAKALYSYGDIFKAGGEIICAQDGKLRPLKDDLELLISCRASLYTLNQDGVRKSFKLDADMKRGVMSSFERVAELEPQEIKSVATTGYATPDRRFVLDPGFDAKTGVYCNMKQPMKLPEIVSRAEVEKALQVMWAPFAAYKWANDESRSGLLAAIFTAVLRPAINTAPGFFIDANVQASGKSKCAEALCAIQAGTKVAPYGFMRGNQDAEYSKYLSSILRTAKRAMILDNCTGEIDSEILSALIFSSIHTSRILGTNTVSENTARIFFVATGNNASLSTDMNRRLVCCRINTGSPKPRELSYDFEPEDMALENRDAIVRAVLTVLKAYWADPVPVVYAGGSDCREWHAMCRAPVLWLIREGLGKSLGVLVDPDKAFGVNSLTATTENSGLTQLIEGLSRAYGYGTKFSAGQVIDSLKSAESTGHWTEPLALIRDGFALLQYRKTGDASIPTAVAAGIMLKDLHEVPNENCDEDTGVVRLRQIALAGAVHKSNRFRVEVLGADHLKVVLGGRDGVETERKQEKKFS